MSITARPVPQLNLSAEVLSIRRYFSEIGISRCVSYPGHEPGFLLRRSDQVGDEEGIGSCRLSAGNAGKKLIAPQRKLLSHKEKRKSPAPPEGAGHSQGERRLLMNRESRSGFVRTGYCGLFFRSALDYVKRVKQPPCQSREGDARRAAGFS